MAGYGNGANRRLNGQKKINLLNSENQIPKIVDGQFVIKIILKLIMKTNR